MFTYPLIGNPYADGAFESGIEALNPVVWYKFDDASFAATITDYGSLEEDLTLNTTPTASAGTALRSDRTKSIRFPAVTNGNWATEGAQYVDSLNAIDGVTSNSAWTILLSLRTDVDTANTHSPICGVHQQSFAAKSSSDSWQMALTNGTGALNCWKRHTTGSTALDALSDVRDSGSSVFLFWWRMQVPGDTGKQDLWEDGAQDDIGNRVGSAVPSTAGFRLGAQWSTEAAPWWESDCLAIWDTALSNAQLADLWLKYSAKKLY
jgi:hypothetical protein